MENKSGEDHLVDAFEYKGIFYNEELDTKIKDEKTGAHFAFQDMCRLLQKLTHQGEEQSKRAFIIKFDPKHLMNIKSSSKK
jgi:hypothetical protein